MKTFPRVAACITAIAALFCVYAFTFVYASIMRERERENGRTSEYALKTHVVNEFSDKKSTFVSSKEQPYLWK